MVHRVLHSSRYAVGRTFGDDLSCRGGCSIAAIAASLAEEIPVIIDLRDSSAFDAVLETLAHENGRFFAALAGPPPRRATPKPPSPRVLLLPDGSALRRVSDFAATRLDSPAFWFMAGVDSIVAADGSGASAVDIANQALDRLHHHPIVAGRERLRELTSQAAYWPFGVDVRAFPRPSLIGVGAVPQRRQELRIVVPSTYQVEGGLSLPLPPDLTDATLRHLLQHLTSPDFGAPSGESGMTIIFGQGTWYSPPLGRYVEEPVRVAHIQLRIDEPTVAGVVSYLQLCWLQDCVFATLEGRVVEAAKELNRPL